MTSPTRQELLGSLDELRESLIESVEHLSDEEARTKLVPSLTTPLGIIRHLNAVEQYWVRHIMCGGVKAEDWPNEPDDDAAWIVDGLSVHALIDIYRQTIEENNSLIGHVDMDAQSINAHEGEHYLLGQIVQKLLIELAAHHGHMDILVEQIVSQRG